MSSTVIKSGRRTHWEQPYGKGLGSPDVWKVLHEPAALAAQKGNCILGCIKREVASRVMEVTPSLLCPYETSSGVLCPDRGPQYKKDRELMEQLQRRPQRWWKGWSTSPMKKGWGSWACLAWRRLWGDLTVAFQYLKRAYKQEEKWLFTQSDKW